MWSKNQVGVLIDFSGDNFMAGFEEPTNAMKAAIDMSSDVERRNHPDESHVA